jgi:hypothetical protein
LGSAQVTNPDSVKRKSIEYFYQIKMGSLIGCTTCSEGKQISFSGSTTHGIKIGPRLRVGAGLGLDSYFTWNIVPIFGSMSWDMPLKKNRLNALVVNFDYGGSLAAWRPMLYNQYQSQDIHVQRNYTYGVGYRIGYNNIQISAGIGRKSQRITTFNSYPTYYINANGDYVMGEPSTETIKNTFNRLMIWMAIGWK